MFNLLTTACRSITSVIEKALFTQSLTAFPLGQSRFWKWFRMSSGPDLARWQEAEPATFNVGNFFICHILCIVSLGSEHKVSDDRAPLEQKGLMVLLRDLTAADWQWNPGLPGRPISNTASKNIMRIIHQ